MTVSSWLARDTSRLYTLFVGHSQHQTDRAGGFVGRRHRVWRSARARRGISIVAVVVLGAFGILVPTMSERRSAAAQSPTYEPLTLADTNFAIPSGAFFVSPTGTDAGAGNLASPFKTVAYAVKTVPVGSTIVLRAGIYRETLGSVAKRLILQAYPHEQAWVDGSVALTNFVASGGRWSVANWNPAICRTCFVSAAIDPLYPAAGLPDQVFYDGAPLRQVQSSSAVTIGTFFVDAAAQSLVLGTDPTGHLVESTRYEKAVQFNQAASGSIVRGIGFRHYAAHYNMDVPAAIVDGPTAPAAANP